VGSRDPHSPAESPQAHSAKDENFIGFGRYHFEGSEKYEVGIGN